MTQIKTPPPPGGGGINQNTNGLIRQYFPKNTDLTKMMNEQIQFIMERLNSRPRTSRGGQSPNELFMGHRDNLLAAKKIALINLLLETKSQKDYSSLNVGLTEQFKIIERLRESCAVQRLREVFDIHRSSYRS